MVFDSTKNISQKAKDSIASFWAGETHKLPEKTNPESLPSLDIEHLFPSELVDPRGVSWALSMSYMQVDLDDKDTQTLWVRYESQPTEPQVKRGLNYRVFLDQVVNRKDFDKLVDHTYVQRRLDEFGEMIEDNVAKLKAQPPMGA